MLDLMSVDLEELASALEGQADYDHRWVIATDTGQIFSWTADGGLDGRNPVDPDELDLVPIDPLPSSAWYADLAEFADALGDTPAGRALSRAIHGRGAFRRFKETLHGDYPQLVSAWLAFRGARGLYRAVTWLSDNDLVDEAEVEQWLAEHPDPHLTLAAALPSPEPTSTAVPRDAVLLGVDAVTLAVPDLDQGLRFYRDALGHALLWRDDARGQAGLRTGSGTTEIVLTTRGTSAPNWLVRSTDEAAAALVEAGGRILAEPTDIPVGRLAVVADPFGNVLVLVDLSKGRYTVDDAGNVTGVQE